MNKIKTWLKNTIYYNYKISIASSDASFRRYFRLTLKEKSVLLMDSSLEKNTLEPFLKITKKLLDSGITVPKILVTNLQEGFLIIEDFGNIHYLDILKEGTFKQLYKKAIDEIIKIQNTSAFDLPIYDKNFLHQEMNLMEEWYLKKLLKKSLSNDENNLLKTVLENISNIVLSQPQNIFVHRDFHSRNIMLTKQNNIGIIDYQDAMNGPLTYDLVSLLKDCYISFNENDINELALYFKNNRYAKVNNLEFLKWFDFMGMQRHLKVLGIFSRLYIRDGKEDYLKDIPLTLKYLLTTALKYKETEILNKLLKDI